MKKLRVYFAGLSIVLLIVLIVGLLIIPQVNQLSAINFSMELTGNLIDSEYNEENPAATDINYLALRSWGLKRGKQGEFPQADPGAPELLARYQSLYIADTTQNTIYLTFDEGYENGYTGKILDVLRDNKVKAIFFITGPYLKKEDSLVKRMVDEGHTVGNHSVNHKSLPLLSSNEIEKELTGLDQAFYDCFGKNMVFLRAPKGEYSEFSLDISTRLGYINVFWSFAYDDWSVNNQRGWRYAYDMITKHFHPGAILLLHAVSADNAGALDAVIQEARNQGYEFGDPAELEKIARRGTQ